MKINQVIKDRIDFLEEVQKVIKINKKGLHYWGLCPFHNEKTPSFCINEQKEIFHCFGCGEHGDIFTLIMKVENKTFMEVINSYCKQLNIKIVEKKLNNKYQTHMDIMQKAHDIYVKQLQNNENAKNYLYNRGISDNSINKFQLGYCSNNQVIEELLSQGYLMEDLEKLGICNSKIGKDRMINRIIFPIINKTEEVIGFSGRNLTNELPKYINSPDSQIFSKSFNVYNQHRINSKEIFLVEGYTDVIAMDQINLCAIAAMSTHFSSENMMYIAKKTRNIYFMLDGDSAGQTALMKNIQNILPYITINNKIFVCTLPQNKDPMDLYREQTIDTYIKESKELYVYLNDMFYNRKKHTPEDWAQVYKEKEELCNLINNKYLKIAYRKFLLFTRRKPKSSSGIYADFIQKETQFICSLIHFPEFILHFLQHLVEIEFRDKKNQKIVDFILQETSKDNCDLENLVKNIKNQNPYITQNLKIFNISSIIVDRSFILRHLENIVYSLYSLNDNVVDAARRILNGFKK